jgi:hypothetical protein
LFQRGSSNRNLDRGFLSVRLSSMLLLLLLLSFLHLGKKKKNRKNNSAKIKQLVIMFSYTSLNPILPFDSLGTINISLFVFD